MYLLPWINQPLIVITNHAVLVILPVQGKRIAMPLDAPPVYRVAEMTVDIGGTGQDLAKQIVTVVQEKLDFQQQNMHYLRGTVLSDIQWLQ